jgi:hypothetical protein
MRSLKPMNEVENLIVPVTNDEEASMWAENLLLILLKMQSLSPVYFHQARFKAPSLQDHIALHIHRIILIL